MNDPRIHHHKACPLSDCDYNPDKWNGRLAERLDLMRAEQDAPRTPTTAAGRRVADNASELWWQPVNRTAGYRSATAEIRADVLAIEAEARVGLAGLWEALEWMRLTIDRHSDACSVLRTASEGGAETDLDSAFGDLMLAFHEGSTGL